MLLVGLSSLLGTALSQDADPAAQSAGACTTQVTAKGELSLKFAEFDCSKVMDLKPFFEEQLGFGEDGAPADQELFIRECGTYDELGTDAAFTEDGGFGRRGDSTLFDYWNVLNLAGTVQEIEYEDELGLNDDPVEGVFVSLDMMFGTGDSAPEAYDNWAAEVNKGDVFKDELEEKLKEYDPDTFADTNVLAYHGAQRQTTDVNCGAQECFPFPGGSDVQPNPDEPQQIPGADCLKCDNDELKNSCEELIPNECIPVGKNCDYFPDPDAPDSCSSAPVDGGDSTADPSTGGGGSDSGGSGTVSTGAPPMTTADGYNPDPECGVLICQELTCEHCHESNIDSCNEKLTPCEELLQKALYDYAKIEMTMEDGPDKDAALAQIVMLECTDDGSLPLTHCQDCGQGSGGGGGSDGSGGSVPLPSPIDGQLCAPPDAYPPGQSGAGCWCVDPITGELDPTHFMPASEGPIDPATAAEWCSKPVPTAMPTPAPTEEGSSLPWWVWLLVALGVLLLCCLPLGILIWCCCCQDKPEPVRPRPKPVKPCPKPDHKPCPNYPYSPLPNPVQPCGQQPLPVMPPMQPCGQQPQPLPQPCGPCGGGGGLIAGQQPAGVMPGAYAPNYPPVTVEMYGQSPCGGQPVSPPKEQCCNKPMQVVNAQGQYVGESI